MKQALISPTEPGRNPWTGEFNGQRVADVASMPFEVADPLFWVECEDDVVADYWWYQDGVFTAFVQPPLETPIVNQDIEMTRV